MSAVETLATLRHLVHQPPSRGAWHQITRTLDAATSAPDTLAAAADYLDAHLGAWPDHLRRAPEAWLHEALHLTPDPRWPLIRHVVLELGSPSQELLTRLLIGRVLKPITCLTLRPPLRSPHLSQLTAAVIAEVLNHPVTDALRELSIEGFPLAVEHALSLASSRAMGGLSALRLRRCGLDDAALAPLLAHPRPLPLRRLDLTDNRLTDAAAAPLVGAALPALETLEVALNPFTREAAAIFASARAEALRAPWLDPRPPARLVLDPGGRELVVFPHQRLTIGRARRSDLLLSDLGVSKEQATLETDAEGLHLELSPEAGSAPRLNGQRLPGRRVWLRDGDRLSIGRSTLSVLITIAPRWPGARPEGDI